MALGSMVGAFYAIRWYCYRPAFKRYPGDRVVTVERSGGGI